MHRYTPEQRRAFAETLHHLIREWVEEGDAHLEIDLKRGIERCTDARSGDPTLRANRTLTLVLKVNGGAEDSEGPPILPTPGVFGGDGGDSTTKAG
jgi:hypothetical protein